MNHYQVVRYDPGKALTLYGLWDARRSIYVAICPSKEAILAALRLVNGGAS